MYILLVILFAAAQSVAFWIDSQISQSLLQYWWLGIVAAYLLGCLDLALRDLGRWPRLLLAACTGLVILASIYLFNDLYAFYLCAIALVVCNLAAWHLESVQSARQNTITRLMLAMLVVAILLMPVSIIRVDVEFPNLSGGTWLTFLKDNEHAELPPESNAVHFNRADIYRRFAVTLGTQVYPVEGQPIPRLRIDIDREKIVARILSIRFRSHIGYIDTTLSDIAGLELEQLIAINKDAGYNMEMVGKALLITGLQVGQPAMIALPPVDTYEIPVEKRILVILLRLLLLAVIWFCSPAWLPRSRSTREKIRTGTSV